jgi:hypothetical protein
MSAIPTDQDARVRKAAQEMRNALSAARRANAILNAIDDTESETHVSLTTEQWAALGDAKSIAAELGDLATTLSLKAG